MTEIRGGADGIQAVRTRRYEELMGRMCSCA
jgi:hypothetical protein